MYNVYANFKSKNQYRATNINTGLTQWLSFYQIQTGQCAD